MPVLTWQGSAYELQEGETVLDCLLRSGVQVAHSCRAGACQACLMQTNSVAPPPQAQTGLKQTMKERGYFLACQFRPTADLEVADPGDEAVVPAVISALEPLSHDVLRVTLQTEAAFDYRSGQYLTLLRADGLARSYSLASLPDETHLELHVRRVAGGAMSGWLFDEAKLGDSVAIRGPAGDCFYTDGRTEQPLLLVGTGTGLAPLYGIVRDALRRGHQGAIHLFHGALEPAGLYLVQELQALAVAYPQFVYQPCTLRGEPADGIEIGEIDKIILARFPKLQGWRAFLCGHPDLVKNLKKRFFLAGAALADIHADAFLPTAPAPAVQSSSS